ncbi:MAG: SGNH/GDSL hydrolase family protein [SAR324 cluster bacterium]|nr:SGNH/GDSL hydrolase family protein [SAR324 cluster bacterium]
MENSRVNWFQKYPKTAAVFLFGATLILLLVGIEYSLQKIMGLGNPVIYQTNPFYGYRPLPNQEVTRFYGAKLKFNNLGLRANENWDENVEDKILFLGDSITYGGSYIANDQLFSHLALEGIEGYMAGNAGVNGWGVENIHGLVVEAEFLPAKIYITMLIEGDFYRDRGRLLGLPFWSRKPRWALEEIFFHYITLLSWSRYRGPDGISVYPEVLEKFLEKSVMRLKEMDEFIKSKGYIHKIYIAADARHLFHNKSKDAKILKLLKKHQVDVEYLIDRLKPLKIDPSQSEIIFYDGGHLNPEGHKLWAKLINDDLKRLLN